MPNIDFIAKWTNPANGHIYESLIVSMCLRPFSDYTTQARTTLFAQIADNWIAVSKYEAGPITDMARDTVTGNYYGREK